MKWPSNVLFIAFKDLWYNALTNCKWKYQFPHFLCQERTTLSILPWFLQCGKIGIKQKICTSLQIPRCWWCRFALHRKELEHKCAVSLWRNVCQMFLPLCAGDRGETLHSWRRLCTREAHAYFMSASWDEKNCSLRSHESLCPHCQWGRNGTLLETTLDTQSPCLANVILLSELTFRQESENG